MRIGNGASNQLQLDIYGEAMDSIYLADQRGLRMGYEGWTEAVTDMLDWLCDNWDQPDEGIWETRGGRKDFTYGRFMSWVALDRAIRMAEDRGRPADVEPLDDGARPDLQADHGARLAARAARPSSRLRQRRARRVAAADAAARLRLPDRSRLALDAGRDGQGRWSPTASSTATIPSASPDGLRGSEGTFSLCTFWYVDALARSGRLDEARLTFEKMFTYANHLGLFSEEIGLTGEQLGNFPQAFSHLALINAAINLDYQLDHGAGNVAAVVGSSVG